MYMLDIRNQQRSGYPEDHLILPVCTSIKARYTRADERRMEVDRSTADDTAKAWKPELTGGQSSWAPILVLIRMKQQQYGTFILRDKQSIIHVV